MKNNHLINISKIVSTLAVTLLISACGSDDNAAPAASDQLTITAANQSAVSALLFDSIDGSATAFMDKNRGAVTGISSKALKIKSSDS